MDEANVALTLASRDRKVSSHATLGSEPWPGENFPIIVKDLCGLFVKVHDSKLTFIHHTAREFLLDSKGSGYWRGRFNVPSSHGATLRSCLYYLVLPDAPDGSDKDGFIDGHGHILSTLQLPIGLRTFVSSFERPIQEAQGKCWTQQSVFVIPLRPGTKPGDHIRGHGLLISEIRQLSHYYDVPRTSSDC